MSAPGNGFPKTSRLLKPAQYRQVFENGLWTRSNHFSACFLSNGMNGSRLGLVISRKLSRRAVDRNRLKRLIRESYRRYQFTRKMDIVVIANRTGLAETNAVILDDLASFWKKIERKCAVS